jgi:transposase InsO family protein
VHIDLFGLTRTKGLNGEQYFMLLYVFLSLRKKSEAFEYFKIYMEMVETETNSKIKCLRSNNGGEFTSKEYMDLYSENGIKR